MMLQSKDILDWAYAREGVNKKTREIPHTKPLSKPHFLIIKAEQPVDDTVLIMLPFGGYTRRRIIINLKFLLRCLLNRGNLRTSLKDVQVP